MIEIKNSAKENYRIAESNSGKYVKVNPETRSRAFFSMLVKNEIAKAQEGYEKLMSVENLANTYGTIAYEFRNQEKIDRFTFDAFMHELDRRIGIVNKADKKFNKLALAVLIDQQDDYSATNIYDVEELKKMYAPLNSKIFAEQKEL